MRAFTHQGFSFHQPIYDSIDFPTVVNPLTILSWNVFRSARPAKIEASLTALVDRHEPDVLLIQEAPQFESRAFADLDVFEAYEPYYAPVHEIAAPSPRYPFVSTGQLTLSRWQPEERELFVLPPVSGALRPESTVSTVRRLALYTRFSTDGRSSKQGRNDPQAARTGRSIGIYNVHLENRSLPAGRLEQVQYLLESVIPSRPDDVVVIGGDLNTFFPSFMEGCLECFQSHGFTNLFATERRLLPRLDYIMVKGAEAVALPIRGRGSDHQPVLAHVSLPGEGQDRRES